MPPPCLPGPHPSGGIHLKGRPMIMVRYVDGRYTPVINCDVCERRIAEAGLAVAVMKHGTIDEAELLPCLHAHKGACHDTAEERLGGKANTGWQELTQHLLFLAHNCKLTPEKLAQFRDHDDQFRNELP